MTHQEIRAQLPDYVLGLLAPDQADQVLEHLGGCATCRQIVQNERQVGQLVHNTLNVATPPDPVRLRQLLPPLSPKSGAAPGMGWTRRLVPALAVFLVLAGAALMRAPVSQRPLPAIVPATATATTTNTPTATIAQRLVKPSGALPASLTGTAGPAPDQANPTGVPAPAATAAYRVASH